MIYRNIKIKLDYSVLFKNDIPVQYFVVVGGGLVHLWTVFFIAFKWKIIFP